MKLITWTIAWLFMLPVLLIIALAFALEWLADRCWRLAIWAVN